MSRFVQFPTASSALAAALAPAAARWGRRVLTGLGLTLCLGGLPTLAGCHNDNDQPDGAGGPDSAQSMIEQGKSLVAMNGCAACHSPTGMSGSVLSGQMNSLPGTSVYGANLTPDSATGVGDWKDDDLARAIREGIDDEGEQLCPSMPRFSKLSNGDIKAIIAYLRSLPATHSEIPESACPPIKPAPTDGGTTDSH